MFGTAQQRDERWIIKLAHSATIGLCEPDRHVYVRLSDGTIRLGDVIYTAYVCAKCTSVYLHTLGHEFNEQQVRAILDQIGRA